MKIALSQIQSTRGDIAGNIQKHISFIEMAAKENAGLVIFPELSVTNYEPELARTLVTNVGDKRFVIFQQLSEKHNLIIAIGMPVEVEQGIEIGLIIFQPGKPVQCYGKQILHADELPYFTGGKKQLLIVTEEERIAPAICYESLQHEHAAKAHQLGATIYLASVSKSASGIEKANAHYPLIASQYQMPVAMVNGTGPADNFIAKGQSAVWDRGGNKIISLDADAEGMILFDTKKITAKKIVA